MKSLIGKSTTISLGSVSYGEQNFAFFSATLENDYKDGKFKVALGSFGPSRINPIAENSVRLARFHFDIDFENYVLNGRTIPLKDTPFTEVEIKSENNGYNLLVYGLYL